MVSESVFFEEWLRSLREQYKHVARSGDSVTLPTLTAVMQNVGFGEDELRQLRLEATLRADDVAEGFVPDLDIISPAESAPTQDTEGQPIAMEAPKEAERLYPSADISQLENAGEAEALTFEDSLALEAEAMEAREADEPPADDEGGDEPNADPDAPQQQSMF